MAEVVVWEGLWLETSVSTAFQVRNGTNRGGWGVGYDRGRSRK